MGGGGDPQKLKKLAASAYDYENDPRWAEYWSNILVPTQKASRSEVLDHFKSKFYQRYIDPELVVERMPSNNSSQTPPLSSSSSSSPSQTEQVPQRSHGSNTRTSGTSSAAGSNAPSLGLNQQTIQFSVNSWVFVVAILAILPIVPKHLSDRAYRLSFMGTTCSSLYSLYILYGKSRAWNMNTLQAWFQPIIVATDFIYFIYCLTFINSHLCLKFALIPVLCRAAVHVTRFLRQNFSGSSLYRKYLEIPCVWVESNTSTLGILSSHAEITLGFLLILSLLSRQRSIIQTFMYWQLLKLMYRAPSTSGYHQSVWSKIGSTVNPLVDRFAPFLNTPISSVRRWWLR